VETKRAKIVANGNHMLHLSERLMLRLELSGGDEYFLSDQNCGVALMVTRQSTLLATPLRPARRG
jgi:hypothetical protein